MKQTFSRPFSGRSRGCVKTTTDSRRRGAILICAMICLLLISLLLGSLLKLALAHRRQVRTEQYRLQAQWLAESAMERSVDRLAADGEYSGEEWNIAAKELDGRHAGSVKISVQKSATRPMQRIVTVEAIYPSGVARSAKRTKQLTVRIKTNP